MYEETVEMIIRKGITKALGARPMKRTAQKYIGDAIRMALRGAAEVRGVLCINGEGDSLQVIP